MASLLHVAIGAAAGRWLTPHGRSAFIPMIGMAALSMLPDADVLAFSFGIPYHHPMGHRGFTHSLAFAVVVAGLVAAIVPTTGRRRATIGLTTAAVVASHPLLDAMTTGGLGVALWWPLNSDRIFLPWRPIPVAPLGRGFLSPRGAAVMMAELLPSLPMLAYALWPRRRPPASQKQPDRKPTMEDVSDI